MANNPPEACDLDLYSLLTKPKQLNFIFRAGRYKHIRLQGHQLPMKNSYCNEHDKTLHKVRFLYYYEDNRVFLLVSAKSAGNLERLEYLVKRAILTLSETYGWVIET